MTDAQSPTDMQLQRYPIVTLCGSTRFRSAFERMNAILTMEGSIVLTVGVYKDYFGRPLTEAEKDRLDKMHLRKINMADSIVVIDVDGYVGESTRSEIEYARQHGKIIARLSEHPEWLEKLGVPAEGGETTALRGIAHNYYSGDHQPYTGKLWDETDSEELKLSEPVRDILRQHEGETIEIIIRSLGIQKQPRMRIALASAHHYEPILWEEEAD
ncbi:MAG: hypothetical protein ACYCYO_01690 [Bacilli bacterium]